MSDGALTLQGAVYAALTAAPPIGAEVYDAVPEPPAYPHIELGGGLDFDWSAADLRGEEHRLDIHVWSRYAGNKEARELMRKIKDRLHEVSLTLGEGNLVDLRYEESELGVDLDGQTRHGIIRFRAYTTI